MANTIQVKRGVIGSLPTLAEGELGFSTDTNQVHIGDGAVNHEVVMHDLFDAQTILAATSDDTPVALTVNASTIVGRGAAGNIAALDAGATRAIIDVAEGATKYPDTGEQAFLDADHTKLDGIDTGATDDQTGAEIKTLYEAEANAFTDTKDTKLTGIEASADVTDATNVDAAGAIMEADYNANTFLYAADDDTPIVKTRAETLALLSGQAAADFAMNTQKITGVVDPVGAQDVATKASSEAYADAIASGLDLKSSVRLATAVALNTYGRVDNVITSTDNEVLPEIDGITPIVGNRILLKDGAADSDNGIYTVTSVGSGIADWILTRATDADTSVEVTAGMYCFVTEGTASADQGWVLTTNDPITLNTTGLDFSQFSSATFVDTFLELTDTPAAFDTGKILRSTADAVELVTFATEYLEGTPTEDLATKAPTSQWAYDHDVATTQAHGAGANTILHSASGIDGGVFP